MSSSHSRKSFFTKMAGLVAALGIAPRLLASDKAEIQPTQATLPVQVTPEPRAVARTPDSV